MFKSRWGFHPCSYETYLQLKQLKKRFWETVYAYERWRRWARKLNRVGDEPKFCPLFQKEKTGHWSQALDQYFLEYFEKVRHGKAEEIEPLHPMIVKRIEDMHQAVEAWQAW